MKRKEPSSLISLMDMLCCAFGGVILLQVIFSAITGTQEVLEHNSYVMARVSLTEAQDPSKKLDGMRIGLRVSINGEIQPCLAFGSTQNCGPDFFFYRNSSELVLVIDRALPGSYQIEVVPDIYDTDSLPDVMELKLEVLHSKQATPVYGKLLSGGPPNYLTRLNVKNYENTNMDNKAYEAKPSIMSITVNHSL